MYDTVFLSVFVRLSHSIHYTLSALLVAVSSSMWRRHCCDTCKPRGTASNSTLHLPSTSSHFQSPLSPFVELLGVTQQGPYCRCVSRRAIISKLSLLAVALFWHRTCMEFSTRAGRRRHTGTCWGRGLNRAGQIANSQYLVQWQCVY